MEETRAGRRHQHASHRHRFCHMPIAPGFLLFSSPAPAPARPSGASATGTVPGCGAALTFSPARPPARVFCPEPLHDRIGAGVTRPQRTNHAEKLPARASVCVWWRVFFYTYVRYERTFYRCAARDREWCAVRWCLASPAVNLLLSAMCVRARWKK